MAGVQEAKLIDNGDHQIVLLPPEFQFEGDEVYIWRDEKTQNVILSTRPEAQPQGLSTLSRRRKCS